MTNEIFLKKNNEQNKIHSFLWKIKNNKYFFDKIFNDSERLLIEKMIKEIDENLTDKKQANYDSEIIKKQQYIDLLMRTKTWGAYIAFYSVAERQLINDMIDEFQSYINEN